MRTAAVTGTVRSVDLDYGPLQGISKLFANRIGLQIMDRALNANRQTRDLLRASRALNPDIAVTELIKPSPQADKRRRSVCDSILASPEIMRANSEQLVEIGASSSWVSQFYHIPLIFFPLKL